VPEDNVKLISEALEAFNRGDFDAVAAIMHPEIEVLRLGGLPTVTGREAARGMLVPDAFEWQRFDVQEISAHGDVVLVRATFHARGAGSGIELNRESHNVFWIEGGLVRKMATVLERDEALDAAGLGRPASDPADG
jgi:ketosteroid isomerase-like protein